VEPYSNDRVPLRAGDEDRERVAEALRRAVDAGRLTVDEGHERVERAYAAKTLEELAALTTDLPERPVAPRPLVRADASPVVAVLSGTKRKGRWIVPERLRTVAILGSVELDLTDAALARRAVTIEAYAVLGSVELRIPEGVRVILTGFAIAGSRECTLPDPADPDALTVHVHALALMGSVEVKRPKRRRLARRKR
jgi:hypothetical protein